jgi:hypothetical protein
MKYGDLEGIVITGLDKRGIALLQSYVDRHADVQTAALMSSRIILPAEWNTERKVCHEWLESYRMFLNNLQMWHSRGEFIQLSDLRDFFSVYFFTDLDFSSFLRYISGL